MEKSDSQTSESSFDDALLNAKYAIALYDYTPRDEAEIQMKENDLLQITSKIGLQKYCLNTNSVKSDTFLTSIIILNYCTEITARKLVHRN